MKLIIPTLWRPAGVVDLLKHYLDVSCVEQVILIDNAHQHRPPALKDLLTSAKLQVLTQENNLLVNASWNLGMSLIRDPTCVSGILNDDISLPATTLMSIEMHAWTNGDVIGLMPDKGYNGSFCLDEIPYNRDISIGSQYQGFGSALFLQQCSYKEIPSNLRIWFGDDWLLQGASRVLGFQDEGIKRDHHVSMKAMRQSEFFRQQLARDKEAAIKLLGFQL